MNSSSHPYKLRVVMTPHRKLLKHIMTHLSFLNYTKMVGARSKMSS